MKNCPRCNVDYPDPPEKYFHKKSSSNDGFQLYCKNCISEFHKDHYKKHKSDYYKRSLKNNSRYRLRNLQYTVDYLKQHPCIDCGETDPMALEFDHRSDKDYNISNMYTRSIENIKKEIAKCDVRCANCHKRKTAKQLGYYKGIVF